MTDLLEAAVRLGREQPEENFDTAETSNFSQQDRVALGDCTWEGGETFKPLPKRSSLPSRGHSDVAAICLSRATRIASFPKHDQC